MLALAAQVVVLLAAVLSPQDRGQIPGSSAGPGAGLLARPARLSVRDVSVASALTQLRHSSRVPLAFSPDLLPSLRSVSCVCDGLSLAAALDHILTGTELSYFVSGEQILIAPRPEDKTVAPPPQHAVVTPLTPYTAASVVPPTRQAPRAQGTVTGHVTEVQTRQPLASVQVSVSNGSISSLTDATGRYRLVNVPAGTHTLNVQRIGYRTASREVAVASEQSLVVNFELEREPLALDEVVVTGTAGGTQRRAIGNVVERMEVAALAEVAPITNVEQMLGSRLPGMISASTAGSLGSDAALIRLRGSSSSALSGEPIVYVDGIRINTLGNTGRDGSTSRLNDINPADIESIEVIKGPAAATLYGTEASNGVIQIITKRGVSGAAVFDATVELGTSWLPNPKSTIPFKYGTSPTTGQLISMHLPSAEEARFGKPFFQYGPIQRFGLSVRGGSNLFRYYASVNRSSEEGVVDWNWEKRNSGRLSLSMLASEGLDITLNGSYMTATTRHPGGYFQSMLRGNVETAADYGGREHHLRGWDQVPESFRDGQEEMEDVDRIAVGVEVAYSPWSWLKSRLIAGSERTDDVRHSTTFREANAPSGDWGFNGLGVRSINSRETRINTVDLTGTTTFGLTDRLGSVTSAGFQYSKKEFWTVSATGNQFATRPLTTVSAGATRTGAEDLLENVTAGVFLQQQFDWSQRIFLTGALRADDNSAFGTQFDLAIYPKLSATWVVDEEPFWTFDFLRPFRVRAAWGAAGQQPDVFAAARLYSPATGPGDVPMLTPASFGNPDLGPERGEELEIGLDAGLFDGRVQLHLTRYWGKTTNAIVARSVSPSEGFPGQQFVNLGQISNWGSEVGADVQLLDKELLHWQMQLSFATMHNRIDDQGDIERIPVARCCQHIEGYPLAGIHSIRVLSADFVSGNSGPVRNVMCDGGTGKDGREFGGVPVPCATAPRLYWGTSEPTWSFNATSTVTVRKDWQLFTTIDGRGGNIFHNDGIASRHDNWINTKPSQLRNDPIHMGYRAVDRTPLGFSKGGFATLRELGVHYSLPTTLVERIGAQRASLNVAARNVAYIWRHKYTMIAPEQIVSPETVSVQTGGGATGPTVFTGEGHSGFPQTTHLLVSMRVSF